MKIDIHTHTKKCKSGDAPTREIQPVDFCEKILSTEVRIIAITNHNVFDLIQFEEIISLIKGNAQVWPGIELDILDNGSRGHLLVIVSPKLATTFSLVVKEITGNISPDTFTVTMEEVLKKFDSLNPLYVAHYKQKKPNISDEILEYLEKNTKNPGCVIKEVTNSISAGIYISHGHPSIYGSDIQDWAKYEELSKDLPDLRLPVDSFEHFCLLLKKDANTINTLLDRKTSEDLILSPFGDGTTLKLRVFNDINVVFGPKGTGKSCILKAIAKHYAANGIEVSVYESGTERLEDDFDLRGKELSINLNNYNINYCSDEIEFIRSAAEISITSMTKYITYFRTTNTNKNAKKILIKDIEPQEESSAKRNFIDINDAVVKSKEFSEFLKENSLLKNELSNEEFIEISSILAKLIERLSSKKWVNFSDWKEIKLLNSAINIFRLEIERKTGTPSKPITTGFREYALNRIQIEINTSKILSNISSIFSIHKEYVGNLGSAKGDLQMLTEFVFQNGNLTDSSLMSISGVKKSTQKSFVNNIRKILDHVYKEDLFQYVSELNSLEEIETINTIYELLLFKRYFALGNISYSPSSGESSMLLLQKELGFDKDVYILDEPERSLGNEYINDVIVPIINERARSGKKVFISTHDANIAVRTLPYSSVYRTHGIDGYSTYLGNPFTNNLVNAEDDTDHLDWKKISMRTLEGGEEAFGERGVIYGNT